MIHNYYADDELDQQKYWFHIFDNIAWYIENLAFLQTSQLAAAPKHG